MVEAVIVDVVTEMETTTVDDTTVTTTIADLHECRFVTYVSSSFLDSGSIFLLINSLNVIINILITFLFTIVSEMA